MNTVDLWFNSCQAIYDCCLCNKKCENLRKGYHPKTTPTDLSAQG
jgi:hypothetical protein